MKKNFLLLFYSLTFLLIIASYAIRTTDPDNETDDNLVNKVVEKKISEETLLKFNQIDSLMNYVYKDRRFNGNIAVNINGEKDYSRSFGYAAFRPKAELTDTTQFQLASVSKQFTAMAIMILKEKNSLSYEDTITKYIPELPYNNITVRHLLNHTSGLPNYMYYIEHHWPQDSIPYNDAVIKLFAEHKPGLNFNPGRLFSYCNTGYALLASIVERVSGKRFSQFVAENIFHPAGMENSFVYSRTDTSSYDNKIWGYFSWRGRYARNEETLHDGIVGDKGIYSTTGDMLKWNTALSEMSLVADSTIAEAFTRVELSNGRNWHYGFGFRIKEVENHKVVYHFGRWNSFKAYFGKYLSENSSVIILNNTNRNINWLVKKIENILVKNTNISTVDEDENE